MQLTAIQSWLRRNGCRADQAVLRTE